MALVFVSVTLAAPGFGALAGAELGPTLDREKEARLDVNSPPMDPVAYASWKAAYLKEHPNGPASTLSEGPGDVYLVTGILQLRQGPYSMDEFLMQNSWQEVVDGTLIQAWAGAFTRRPEQGVILVRRSKSWPYHPGHGHSTTQTFDAPSGAGALRITSYDWLVLTVRGGNGTAYDFDIQDGTYTAAA